MKRTMRTGLFVVLAALAACKREAEAEPAVAIPVVDEVSAQATPEPRSSVDATAEYPTFKLPALDGSTYDLAAHRGKWVVVNFWATWCAPCLKEMPDLDALDKARDDIDVVGLAYDEIEAADMRAFLKEHPVSYPIVIVDVFAPPADFATPRGLPMTHLIAPDGKALKPFLGPVTAQEIEEAIAAHGKEGKA
ncbi:thioredoxin [Pseudoxanthomonas sangjuensis]|uniref:TlpA family protein disulfide reductase n=1 Tax=Pseudoxanthomonas sangjuensis TaxID=1503750 RepID=UPI001391DC9B|nr:TlpA disulfide reductase family protein [Pseudoxanthomonas sangjuensis]KAF1706334.1 thioredoxin [Pseudoxanthomonas sangjuensis]